MAAPRVRRAVVVTVSTRAAAGRYADRSGPVLADGLRSMGFDVEGPLVVADGPGLDPVLRAAVAGGADVVVTTGGTGLAPDDVTPEVTAALLDRPVPGIAEELRRRGIEAGIATAALSRGIAGLAGGTWSSTCRGRPVRCATALAVLGPLLAHAVDQIHGGDHAAPVDAPSNVGGQRRDPGVAGHAARRPGRRCRPLRLRDSAAWREVRLRNVAWLRPWEATAPDETSEPPPDVRRDGAAAPGRGEGRAHAAVRRDVRRPAGRPGDARRHHVRLAAQRLHRVLGRPGGGRPRHHAHRRGAGDRPCARADAPAPGRDQHPARERAPAGASSRSSASASRGCGRAYLHIDGDWRDHLSYALTAEEVPGGAAARAGEHDVTRRDERGGRTL